MELTANQRPFLYFPLGNHFEQNLHVRQEAPAVRWGALYVIRRVGSGRTVDYRPVEITGAARAAAHISELL